MFLNLILTSLIKISSKILVLLVALPAVDFPFEGLRHKWPICRCSHFSVALFRNIASNQSCLFLSELKQHDVLKECVSIRLQ